jgi:hypothetical protein
MMIRHGASVSLLNNQTDDDDDVSFSSKTANKFGLM